MAVYIYSIEKKNLFFFKNKIKSMELELSKKYDVRLKEKDLEHKRNLEQMRLR